ncbi:MULTISPECIES: IclR family transcriptional regulator [unclassified Acidovorax]|uniref:IclR family transcriptional regulator n=1 Tax=unclassified Acidovorax TaxID=2684926 RepID=UPI001C47E232|nr:MULTISPECIES: IclR family transcriptional regulator [unclassified Acidovorax]MBV7429566.1 IclR family transcriptional regulator [Acidovorax sp. sif0732]MBV7448644.1 IclR family transcriptional regulator [Acidovorax sp. sif0715]
MPPPRPAHTPRAPLARPPQDRHFVTALARGLEVLACFRAGDKLLGNQEIAQRCRLPKSTVSRLTATLTRLGYLIHVEACGKYRLGTATLSLGSSMLVRLDVRQVARPLMQELADFAGAEVSMGTRDRLSMIYVENCRSAALHTLSLDVGSRISLATSAMGRAWLAAVPPKERSAVLAQIQGRDETAWPQVQLGIDQALQDYRGLSVATSFGDWQKNVNAIARGFQPGGGLPPMVINCGGPAFNVPQDFLLDAVRPRLIEIVARIETAVYR